MISLRPLFAQETLPMDLVSEPWKKMDAATRDVLIILGSVAVVSLLALTWAVAFRKRRHHHPRRHSQHHSHDRSKPPEPIDEEITPSEPGSERRRHRHRRRREHRPRNPTLAETGGLPPIRTERPHDPCP